VFPIDSLRQAESSLWSCKWHFHEALEVGDSNFRVGVVCGHPGPAPGGVARLRFS